MSPVARVSTTQEHNELELASRCIVRRSVFLVRIRGLDLSVMGLRRSSDNGRSWCAAARVDTLGLC